MFILAFYNSLLVLLCTAVYGFATAEYNAKKRIRGLPFQVSVIAMLLYSVVHGLAGVLGHVSSILKMVETVVVMRIPAPATAAPPAAAAPPASPTTSFADNSRIADNSRTRKRIGGIYSGGAGAQGSLSSSPFLYSTLQEGSHLTTLLQAAAQPSPCAFGSTDKRSRSASPPTRTEEQGSGQAEPSEEQKAED